MNDTSLVTDLRPAYSLGPNVFLTEQNGVARLLDFHRGRFYGLDAIGTAMVTRLLRERPVTAVAGLAYNYGVEEGIIRNDLAELLRNLLEKGLLRYYHDGEEVSQKSTLSRSFLGGMEALFRGPARLAKLLLPRWPIKPCAMPSPLQVSWLLKQTWLSLRLRGWEGTVDRWRVRRLLPLVSPPKKNGKSLTGWTGAREAASRQFLVPMACKERALAAFHLLQGYGLRAELVIGVHQYPFEAHAWVESDGRTITDDAERCASFTPVARFR